MQTTAAETFRIPRSHPVSNTLKPVAVFGKDNRKAVPEKWSALEGRIGMLYEPSTQTLCTAFCVKENIIATASHCLFQPKHHNLPDQPEANRLPNLSEVTFRLRYGEVLRQSKIAGNNTAFVKNNIAVGTTSYQKEPPLTAAKDWALVKLETPICQFGVLKVRPLKTKEIVKKAQRKRIFQIAYHWDYEHWKLAYSQSCGVLQDFGPIKWASIQNHFRSSKNLVLHQCDTGGASSGSPILMDTSTAKNRNSTPVVVGINVSTFVISRNRIKQGRIVKRLKPDVIANIAVNAMAFHHVIVALGGGNLLDTQSEMLTLQKELRVRGIYTGQLDGNLGRQLRRAIIHYEDSNNLPVTGIPSRTLLRQLVETRTKPSLVYSTGFGSINDLNTKPSSKRDTAPAKKPDKDKKTDKKEEWDPFKMNR